MISFWSRTIDISNKSIGVVGRGLGWYDLGMDPIDPNWFGIDPKILSFFPNWIPMKRCSTILPYLCVTADREVLAVCISTQSERWHSDGWWCRLIHFSRLNALLWPPPPSVCITFPACSVYNVASCVYNVHHFCSTHQQNCIVTQVTVVATSQSNKDRFPALTSCGSQAGDQCIFKSPTVRGPICHVPKGFFLWNKLLWCEVRVHKLIVASHIYIFIVIKYTSVQKWGSTQFGNAKI